MVEEAANNVVEHVRGKTIRVKRSRQLLSSSNLSFMLYVFVMSYPPSHVHIHNFTPCKYNTISIDIYSNSVCNIIHLSEDVLS